MTPAQRRLLGRIGAFTLHARGGTNTGPARAAFNSRWDRAVDPLGELDPRERARRAQAARSAYFTRLAFESSRARGEKRNRRLALPSVGAKAAPAQNGPGAEVAAEGASQPTDAAAEAAHATKRAPAVIETSADAQVPEGHYHDRPTT